MTAPPAFISARGLTRLYTLGQSEVVGIADIDLDIARGEMVVLKGDSGSGKSTLLSLLGALDRPTSGHLSVAGRDLMRLSAAHMTRFRREAVGMVFQSFNLLPTLTVAENICLPALLAANPPAATEKRAGSLMEWLGLDRRRDHLPSQLSGGEMQRTAIARALINNPTVLLADEPTGNLDSSNGQMVIDLLAYCNRRWDRTIVIATHSNLADPIATTSLWLRDGRLFDAACTR
jgi:ABC-type lipoprotein export system ATPase subunit